MKIISLNYIPIVILFAKLLSNVVRVHVYKNRIFLYLCTFPFNHIPITTSIVVEYIYSFWNASHSVEPLSHILKNSLIHLKKNVNMDQSIIFY